MVCSRCSKSYSVGPLKSNSKGFLVGEVRNRTFECPQGLVWPPRQRHSQIYTFLSAPPRSECDNSCSYVFFTMWEMRPISEVPALPCPAGGHLFYFFIIPYPRKYNKFLVTDVLFSMLFVSRFAIF